MHDINFDAGGLITTDDHIHLHVAGACCAVHDGLDVFAAAVLRDMCGMLYHGARGGLWLPSTQFCWCNGPDAGPHEVPTSPVWTLMPAQSERVWEFLDQLDAISWFAQEVWCTVLPFPTLPRNRRDPVVSLHVDVEAPYPHSRMREHLTSRLWMAADAGDSLSVAVPLSRPIRSHEANLLTAALARNLQEVAPSATIRSHRSPRRWPSSLATMKAEGEAMEVRLATPLPRQAQDVDELAALLGVPRRDRGAPARGHRDGDGDPA